MSVMPVFWGGKACFFAHGKCEKWKNSIDNITGGGKLNSGKNKIHNTILRRNEIMKKKLIINHCRSHCIRSICNSLRQQCTVYRICSK